ncbi:ABC transporter ATP-binding protein [Domibacillus sp. DTU_2020_1001157_1_SI_ALB_TIR_016]|uniref:ABC transporter ATP-binding protein n=1 Tax=Domibacillus sp. DTU_2020_1001157_1_SI_ALB_TIR_016 TaxID=3077789 RepID=UPI0028F0F73D|nr:ABC transporter ATP-binding protein [Domibacillus sp. DTU_2020_1001157_1_SI_ALB_TIR_016]WNS80302.1 ABC transporter ATP-binding protein [Domibacillus sp. DTU_2020_1001157_1_SI_ALB_TIR_016]
MKHPGNNREAKPQISNMSETLKRIGRYLLKRKGKLMLTMVMVALGSALALAGPFLIGKAIDDYIASGNERGLLLLLAGLALVYVSYSAVSFLQNYWMVEIAQRTVYELRDDLFRHFHTLPISFFDKRRHGELMSRVTNDIDNISSTLNSSIIQVASGLLTLTGSIVVMLYLSPLLTAVTLLIIPLMFGGMKWITSRTGPRFKEQQRHLGDLNGFIEEAISSRHIVKMFSREEDIIEEFMEKNERLREAGYLAQAYSGFIPKLMNVLNNAGFAVIAFVGGVLALSGQATVGTIVIFTEYARQFTRPLNDLANQYNTMLSAVAGAERVFDIMDTDEAVDRKKGQTPLLSGEIVFDDVSFSYEEGKKTLSHVSFHALPGEMIALIGPTGSGKTTIMNLLVRFYEPDGGKILFDGIDSREISGAALRSQMGFVLQDTVLFEGTVMENIRYGRLNATDEEVIEAAKQANAHSFIERMPDGYDSMLKQDGSGISQGQRQLLAIARAILADPVLLILDEATSSIDTITELHIQEALGRLMKGRTSFVIAHRLNTIRRADQVIRLKNGGIQAIGSYEEVVAAAR